MAPDEDFVDFELEDQLRAQLARLRQLRELKIRQQKQEAEGARQYLNDPVGWIRRFIRWAPGDGLTDYQEDAAAQLPRRKRVAVRGPHGLGKTGLASLVVLWFSITREQAGLDWKVLTTASAWRHLTVYLWPEIHKWAARLDWEALGRQPFNERTELLGLTLKQRNGAASAVASSKAELIEGAHADSLLYLIDEAKIVPDAVWDAIEGAFSGGRMEGYPEALALAISTPGPPVGRFYEIHKKAPGLEDWWTRHVKVEEAIAAGRISEAWVDQRRRQWGADSALFANRVLGEFHASDEDSLIPLAWVDAAIERWRDWDDAGRPQLIVQHPRVISVDVARFGGDATIIGRRIGYTITEFETHNREDTMKTAARVGPLLADGSDPDKPKTVGIVDSAGVGGGVFDRLRELKRPVLAYTGASKTDFRDRTGEFGFVNCLTEDARVRPIGVLYRIYRARYNGPLFRVQMASGDQFTATPNHKVLADGGWVAVQSLNVGDQLCRPPGGGGVAIDMDEDGVPPTIGEIYRAARSIRGSEWVAGASVNFHGDRPTGDVEVVTVNRPLRSFRPIGGEERQQGPLGRALLSQSALSILGQRSAAAWVPHLQPIGHERRLPLARGRRRAHPAFGSGELGCQQSIGGGIVADLHSPVAQGTSEHRVRYAKAAAERLHGLPPDISAGQLGVIKIYPTQEGGRFGQSTNGHCVLAENAANHVQVHPEVPAQGVGGRSTEVAFDQVVSVDIVAPGTHVETSFVYTMETSTGTYRTTSIAHRNCRSGAYWNLRELLDPANDSVLMLPPDDLMVSDLTTPTWDIRSGAPPKIVVEKKDDVVARLGRSPDRGDMVVMAYWFEQLRKEIQVAKAPPGRLPVHRELTPLAGPQAEDSRSPLPRRIPGIGAIRRPRESAMGPLG